MTHAPDALRSERLDLDPLTPLDADEMVGVLGDPRLYEFIGGSPSTLDELHDRYGRLSVGRSADGREEWRNWVVRTRADGRAIGTVQATIAEGGKRASIAWVIGVPWQGRGFATEAATTLVRWLVDRGVSQIAANINPAHAASEAVARRVGLEPTDELVDGERVWRPPNANPAAHSQTQTDESR